MVHMYVEFVPKKFTLCIRYAFLGTFCVHNNTLWKTEMTMFLGHPLHRNVFSLCIELWTFYK